MSPAVFWVALISLGLTFPAVAARSEYVLTGDSAIAGGQAWISALAANPGFYVVFDDEGQLIESVPVGLAPLGAGADTLIDYSNGTIQSVKINPTWNLARRLELANGRITSSMTYGYLYAELESIVLSYDVFI